MDLCNVRNASSLAVELLCVPSSRPSLLPLIASTSSPPFLYALTPVRVETEHLGNADAYRVTREIPLPYRDTKRSDSDDDLGPSKSREPKKATPLVAKLKRFREAVVGRDGHGRGLDALNVGARGHAAQREYEARRPGDMVRSSSMQRPSTIQRSATRRTNTSDDSNV